MDRGNDPDSPENRQKIFSDPPGDCATLTDPSCWAHDPQGRSPTLKWTDMSLNKIIAEGFCIGCGSCAFVRPDALAMRMAAHGLVQNRIPGNGRRIAGRLWRISFGRPARAVR